MRKTRFVWLVVWALLFAGCGDGGSGTAGTDGDSATEHDSDEPGESADGDGELSTDSDRTETPEEEAFSWVDDTYGLWRDEPFCPAKLYALQDDFEDGNFTETPTWHVDPTVEENPGGEMVGISLPLVIDEARHGKVLSFVQSEGSTPLPKGRLYHAVGDGVYLTNAFHGISKLSEEKKPNFIWFSDDTTPGTGWAPQIQIWHESGESGETVRVLDETGLEYEQCHVEGLNEGWRRFELFVLDADSYRLDVDRITRCTFDHALNNDFQTFFLFLGGSGYFDDLILGQCLLPDPRRACGEDRSCQIGETCGRDGACYTPRGQTCRSKTTCHMVDAESDCIAETDYRGEPLGDGTCGALCLHHEECRPYEACLPVSRTQGVCRALCAADGACPSNESCLGENELKGCLPDDCKENGGWASATGGVIDCACQTGFSEDPMSHRCEDLGACTTTADCGPPLKVCGGGICYKTRQVQCAQIGACPESMECAGFIINDELAYTGMCRYPCDEEGVCLPYEICAHLFDGKRACLQVCTEEGDCPDGLACLEGGEGKVCLPALCQTHGSWQFDAAKGEFVCTCIDGAIQDPFNGRCRL